GSLVSLNEERSSMPEHIEGRGSRRAGFTLPEVLVSVAMMAVLAAVVIPAVVGQIGKSEVARVVQDLQAVDAATQVFRTDIGRWPGSIAHLVTPIDTDDAAIDAVNYTATEVAAWRGPYLALPSLGATLESGGGTTVALALGNSTSTTPIATIDGGSPDDWVYMTVT